MAMNISKALNLDNSNHAAAWMIQFMAQAGMEYATEDTKLKQLFIAKCGIDAILKLRDLLFPALIDSEDCTFQIIKNSIERITKPAEKFWLLKG
jgi:hypothetical protein